MILNCYSCIIILIEYKFITIISWVWYDIESMQLHQNFDIKTNNHYYIKIWMQQ